MSHRARLVLKLNRSATQITRDDLLGASDIGDGSSKTVGIGIDAVELVPVTIRGGAGNETVSKDPGLAKPAGSVTPERLPSTS